MVAAVRTWRSDGGVTNVNLCRPEDIDRELFTFDGAGTLFTSGGYVELGPLRVDDLPAVERLVAQGTADGLLRPRTRLEVARLAVTGLGARVVGSGHLAGIVSLDTERLRGGRAGRGGVPLHREPVLRSGRRRPAGRRPGRPGRHRRPARGLRRHGVVRRGAFFVRKGFTEVAHDAGPGGQVGGLRRRPPRPLAGSFLRPTPGAAASSLGF